MPYQACWQFPVRWLKSSLVVGKCTFTATDKGLLRKCKDGKTLLSFPTKRSYALPPWHLHKAVGKVKAVKLVKPEDSAKQKLGILPGGKIPGKVLATFKPEEVTKVNEILARAKPCTIEDMNYTYSMPRWQEVIFLELGKGKVLQVHLIKEGLRVSLAKPLDGDVYDLNFFWMENVHDFILPAEDIAWFYMKLTKYLGERKERIYVEPEFPMDEDEDDY
jgi:hypothetical protein